MRRAVLAGLLLAGLAAPAPADVTPGSRLTHAGLGDVRIGMTEREAERAGGLSLVSFSGRPSAPRSAGCFYLVPRDRAIRAELMLSRGRVVRIDLVRRGLRALGGVRVGDAEAQVRSRFAGRLRATPTKYVPGGWDLEVRASSRALRNRRVIFVTDGTRVTSIRAGRLPEVRLVERCG